MKKIKSLKFKLLVFALISLSLLTVIILASDKHSTKNMIIGCNNKAEQIKKQFDSNSMFVEYCRDNNIPQNEVVFLNGTITSYMDYYVDSNQYCSKEVCLSPSPHENKYIDEYWTVKIFDNKIREVWVSYNPIKSEQLKYYSFQDQIKMIPRLKKDSFKYAIGYYNAD